jgi:UDP-N-acetylglucosamine--N-acetylmuramyl-(pentapeptide) pyrophosphoryl-undecaprenol N-acetylglucosamine transferase
MKWVIAGGGTGGHLFPGIAIAEAFVGREMGNEVLFIGTERGIEAKVLAGGKFPLRTIRARPLKGRSFFGKLRALWTIPMAISEAFSILKEFQPQLVLGVGGYASGPTLLAASLLRMKRAIHEQNVVPGMTNRILKRFSQRIFVSFEETKKYFPEGKTVVTGNPIRKEISACISPIPDRQATGKKGDRFTILVFGGSAGAHRINVAMMEALSSLEGVKSSLRFIHQTGREDVEFVLKGYQERGFDALVRPFFEEMAMYYQISDLVVCRSGASTVAELATCGKAAILIPYPYAAHNHQFINAKKLVDLGAARMISDEEMNGSLLSQTILHLYNHLGERVRMEEAIRHVGRPWAAKEIVDHCYALLGKAISNAKAQSSNQCQMSKFKF